MRVEDPPYFTREEPLVFRPGQFYVLTAVAGAIAFVFLTAVTPLESTPWAIIVIAVTFVFRALAIVFNWRTSAVAPAEPSESPAP